MKFYPSYSALTFPLVITALAMKAAYQYFTRTGDERAWLPYLVRIAFIIALIFLLYVLIGYIHHYLIDPVSMHNLQPTREA